MEKLGRPRSPRTEQIHTKLRPEVASAISAEAARRGVSKGLIIEEAWRLYEVTGGLNG